MNKQNDLTPKGIKQTLVPLEYLKMFPVNDINKIAANNTDKEKIKYIK